MFDIGWSEMLVIGVVALMAIGPKELPGVLRTVGQWMGKIRRMANEFQGQFQEAMREAEMADLKKQVDDVTGIGNIGNFDPLGDVQKDIENLASGPAASPPADSAAAPAASVSPEAASEALPAPVSADFSGPQPSPTDTTIAPEAPQPKVGSG
jgi:sec-independent protein translocase protein TatB